MNFFRKLRRLLSGERQLLRTDPFKAMSLAFERKVVLFRVFYVFVFFVSMSNFDVWNYHLSGPALIPLWPLLWIKHFSLSHSVYFILGFQLVGGIIGVFFCRYRFVRTLVFLGLLEYVALRSSYGKIGHSFHLLTLISFLLIFLPKGWSGPVTANREVKAKTILVFTACQFMIMASYSLAGLGKIVMAFYQMAAGEIHAFHFKALSLHIAQRLLETSDRSLLGPWLIDHSIYAWPMMQATLYLQFFAILVVLRPSLHHLWCGGLIMFHVFSFFILTINFPFNCFLLGLFFLAENPAPSSLRRMLAQLPVFGMFFRRVFPNPA